MLDFFLFIKKNTAAYFFFIFINKNKKTASFFCVSTQARRGASSSVIKRREFGGEAGVQADFGKPVGLFKSQPPRPND